MTSVEDRIWGELMREPEAALALAARQPRAAPPRSWRGPLIGAGGIAAIAAAIAAISLTNGTSTAPAYAVSVNEDGTVTVTIDELVGVSEASARLARLGVRATIVAVQPGCTATVEKAAMPANSVSTIFYNVKGGFTIRPSAIPAGESLLISAQGDSHGVALSIGMYRGPAPGCVPPEDAPPE